MPGPNDFCFCISKSVTPCSKLRPWTLWTVNADAYVNRNWLDADADPFFIEISVWYFSIGTQEFCPPK